MIVWNAAVSIVPGFDFSGELPTPEETAARVAQELRATTPIPFITYPARVHYDNAPEDGEPVAYITGTLPEEQLPTLLAALDTLRASLQQVEIWLTYSPAILVKLEELSQ